MPAPARGSPGPTPWAATHPRGSAGSHRRWTACSARSWKRSSPTWSRTIAADPEAGAGVVRPSATVVLARAGAQAAELYLVRRASGATFGASYVFPGGLLEAA